MQLQLYPVMCRRVWDGQVAGSHLEPKWNVSRWSGKVVPLSHAVMNHLVVDKMPVALWLRLMVSQNTEPSTSLIQYKQHLSLPCKFSYVHQWWHVHWLSGMYHSVPYTAQVRVTHYMASCAHYRRTMRCGDKVVDTRPANSQCCTPGPTQDTTYFRLVQIT